MIYFCNFYIFSPYLAGSCLSRHAFRPEKCSVRLLLRDEIIRKRHKYDAADHISKIGKTIAKNQHAQKLT